jgi:hypothetical membrane protein
MTRHDLSLMANGDRGWVHIALLIATGLLTIGAAMGLRRVLHGTIGATWGPLLLALYGLGLVGAGIFTADPAFGFPPGTPSDYHAVSWHGLLHLVSGGVGFLGLIAACMVFARRFARRGQGQLATYSVATGVLYLAAFVGIAAGSNGGRAVMTVVILAFTAAVVLGWAWISAVATLVLRDLS